MSFSLAEPSVTITDYILSAFCLWWAISLQRLPHSEPKTRRYAMLFFGIAATAFLGGTYHGFHHVLTTPLPEIMWKSTQAMIAISALILLNIFLGELSNVLSLGTRFGILTGFTILFGVVIFVFDQFIACIAIYLFTMIGMIILSYQRMKVTQSGYYQNLMIGLLISVFAAGLQMSGINLHKHMTHNDLYHLTQLLGAYFIYRGVLSLNSFRTL